MSNLEEFARFMFKPAQALVRHGDELTPVMVFDSPEGGGIVAIPEYGKDEAKAPIRAALSALIREKHATRYLIVLEAWMGEGKGNKPPDVRPRNDPNRKEAIVISAADSMGGQIVLMSYITREPAISFSEPEAIPVVASPLLELLTKPTMN